MDPFIYLMINGGVPTVSTVLTAALLFKSSFVGAGLKREFTKARIFKIASIYGSFLRAGVIREAAVNTVDTVDV